MFRALNLHRCRLTERPTCTALKLFSSPLSTKQSSEPDPHDDVSLINRDPTSPPRLFVVQPRLRPDAALHAKLNEALCLANSLEEQRDGFFQTDFFEKAVPPHVVVQNPAARSPKPRADTYFGPGTLDNIKCHLYAEEEKGEVDAVFVNATLSGIQQRNLERIWEKPVLDRVGLIIEIFNAHAFTKEAKLQAELAALTYKKTRLVRVRGPGGRLTFGVGGEAEVVSARGRGTGGQGFISGAGETELQLQRRRILERRIRLLSLIEEVRRTRALQRASRKRHGGSFGHGLSTVAVVGYTNAGKSTLVGALSESDLYGDDRLFATVDPRLRSIVLPSGRKVLLSDTVGFISDLPVQLVEAFHATLEEVAEADLLVHVLDSSAPNLDEHRASVLQVLEQIGVSQEKLQNMIEVWNKIDLREDQMQSDGSVSDTKQVEFENLSDEDDGNFSTEELTIESLSGEDDGNILSVPSSQDKSSHGIDLLFAIDDDDASASTKSVDEPSPRELDDLGTMSSIALGSSTRQHQTGSIKHEPDVKTSAVTGVGLQELLELMDEKLEVLNGRAKSEHIVERGIFDRKWRPPRDGEGGIAAEQ
ncbi:hypothetical protein SAY87_002255 [Trapa incisa]|uniref:Hflx-type G domain-containing protein n=1 Tax=Trapa incisa TaxID=236973 RepID=A0AAN7JUI2_9MYRT|nr:hypothetical protein SAY87_002255 [Trapa incisa]